MRKNRALDSASMMARVSKNRVAAGTGPSLGDPHHARETTAAAEAEPTPAGNIKRRKEKESKQAAAGVSQEAPSPCPDTTSPPSASGSVQLSVPALRTQQQQQQQQQEQPRQPQHALPGLANCDAFHFLLGTLVQDDVDSIVCPLMVVKNNRYQQQQQPPPPPPLPDKAEHKGPSAEWAVRDTEAGTQPQQTKANKKSPRTTRLDSGAEHREGQRRQSGHSTKEARCVGSDGEERSGTVDKNVGALAAAAGSVFDQSVLTGAARLPRLVSPPIAASEDPVKGTQGDAPVEVASLIAHQPQHPKHEAIEDETSPPSDMFLAFSNLDNHINLSGSALTESKSRREYTATFRERERNDAPYPHPEKKTRMASSSTPPSVATTTTTITTATTTAPLPQQQEGRHAPSLHQVPNTSYLPNAHSSASRPSAAAAGGGTATTAVGRQRGSTAGEAVDSATTTTAAAAHRWGEGSIMSINSDVAGDTSEEGQEEEDRDTEKTKHKSSHRSPPPTTTTNRERGGGSEQQPSHPCDPCPFPIVYANAAALHLLKCHQQSELVGRDFENAFRSYMPRDAGAVEASASSFHDDSHDSSNSNPSYSSNHIVSLLHIPPPPASGAAGAPALEEVADVSRLFVQGTEASLVLYSVADGVYYNCLAVSQASMGGGRRLRSPREPQVARAVGSAMSAAHHPRRSNNSSSLPHESAEGNEGEGHDDAHPQGGRGLSIISLPSAVVGASVDTKPSQSSSTPDLQPQQPQHRQTERANRNLPVILPSSRHSAQRMSSGSSGSGSASTAGSGGGGLVGGEGTTKQQQQQLPVIAFPSPPVGNGAHPSAPLTPPPPPAPTATSLPNGGRTPATLAGSPDAPYLMIFLLQRIAAAAAPPAPPQPRKPAGTRASADADNAPPHGGGASTMEGEKCNQDSRSRAFRRATVPNDDEASLSAQRPLNLGDGDGNTANPSAEQQQRVLWTPPLRAVHPPRGDRRNPFQRIRPQDCIRPLAVRTRGHNEAERGQSHNQTADNRRIHSAEGSHDKCDTDTSQDCPDGGGAQSLPEHRLLRPGGGLTCDPNDAVHHGSRYRRGTGGQTVSPTAAAPSLMEAESASPSIIPLLSAEHHQSTGSLRRTNSAPSLSTEEDLAHWADQSIRKRNVKVPSSPAQRLVTADSLDDRPLPVGGRSSLDCTFATDDSTVPSPSTSMLTKEMREEQQLSSANTPATGSLEPHRAQQPHASAHPSRRTGGGVREPQRTSRESSAGKNSNSHWQSLQARPQDAHALVDNPTYPSREMSECVSTSAAPFTSDFSSSEKSPVTPTLQLPDDGPGGGKLRLAVASATASSAARDGNTEPLTLSTGDLKTDHSDSFAAADRAAGCPHGNNSARQQKGSPSSAGHQGTSSPFDIGFAPFTTTTALSTPPRPAAAAAAAEYGKDDGDATKGTPRAGNSDERDLAARNRTTARIQHDDGSSNDNTSPHQHGGNLDNDDVTTQQQQPWRSPQGGAGGGGSGGMSSGTGLIGSFATTSLGSNATALLAYEGNMLGSFPSNYGGGSAAPFTVTSASDPYAYGNGLQNLGGGGLLTALGNMAGNGVASHSLTSYAHAHPAGASLTSGVAGNAYFPAASLHAQRAHIVDTVTPPRLERQLRQLHGVKHVKLSPQLPESFYLNQMALMLMVQRALKYMREALHVSGMESTVGFVSIRKTFLVVDLLPQELLDGASLDASMTAIQERHTVEGKRMRSQRIMREVERAEAGGTGDESKDKADRQLHLIDTAIASGAALGSTSVAYSGGSLPSAAMATRGGPGALTANRRVSPFTPSLLPSSPDSHSPPQLQPLTMSPYDHSFPLPAAAASASITAGGNPSQHNQRNSSNFNARADGLSSSGAASPFPQLTSSSEAVSAGNPASPSSFPNPILGSLRDGVVVGANANSRHNNSNNHGPLSGGNPVAQTDSERIQQKMEWLSAGDIEPLEHYLSPIFIDLLAGCDGQVHLYRQGICAASVQVSFPYITQDRLNLLSDVDTVQLSKQKGLTLFGIATANALTEEAASAANAPSPQIIPLGYDRAAQRFNQAVMGKSVTVRPLTAAASASVSVKEAYFHDTEAKPVSTASADAAAANKGVQEEAAAPPERTVSFADIEPRQNTSTSYTTPPPSEDPDFPGRGRAALQQQQQQQRSIPHHGDNSNSNSNSNNDKGTGHNGDSSNSGISDTDMPNFDLDSQETTVNLSSTSVSYEGEVAKEGHHPYHQHYHPDPPEVGKEATGSSSSLPARAWADRRVGAGTSHAKTALPPGAQGSQWEGGAPDKRRPNSSTTGGGGSVANLANAAAGAGMLPAVLHREHSSGPLPSVGVEKGNVVGTDGVGGKKGKGTAEGDAALADALEHTAESAPASTPIGAKKGGRHHPTAATTTTTPTSLHEDASGTTATTITTAASLVTTSGRIQPLFAGYKLPASATAALVNYSTALERPEAKNGGSKADADGVGKGQLGERGGDALPAGSPSSILVSTPSATTFSKESRSRSGARGLPTAIVVDSESQSVGRDAGGKERGGGEGGRHGGSQHGGDGSATTTTTHHSSNDNSGGTTASGGFEWKRESFFGCPNDSFSYSRTELLGFGSPSGFTTTAFKFGDGVDFASGALGSESKSASAQPSNSAVGGVATVATTATSSVSTTPSLTTANNNNNSNSNSNKARLPSVASSPATKPTTHATVAAALEANNGGARLDLTGGVFSSSFAESAGGLSSASSKHRKCLNIFIYHSREREDIDTALGHFGHCVTCITKPDKLLRFLYGGLPGVDVLVIECTRELLSAELKHALLYDRPALHVVMLFHVTTRHGQSKNEMMAEDPIAAEVTQHTREDDIVYFSEDISSAFNDRETFSQLTASILRMRLQRQMFDVRTRNSYQIVRQIGSGAFGDVFEVVMFASRGRLAMKRIFLKSASFKIFEQLYREVQIMSLLDHQNIITFSHTRLDDNAYEIFMELGDGTLAQRIMTPQATEGWAQRDTTNLASPYHSGLAPPGAAAGAPQQHRRHQDSNNITPDIPHIGSTPHKAGSHQQSRRGSRRNSQQQSSTSEMPKSAVFLQPNAPIMPTPIAPQEAVLIVHDICSAIEYLHSKNIIHRDIKPVNILFSNGIAKLGDFGSAVKVNENRPLTNMKGTMSYMAPEVVLGEPYGKPCDMWSLGCVIADIMGVSLGHLSGLHMPALTELYRSIPLGESLPVTLTNKTNSQLENHHSAGATQRLLDAVKEASQVASRERKQRGQTTSSHSSPTRLDASSNSNTNNNRSAAVNNSVRSVSSTGNQRTPAHGLSLLESMSSPLPASFSLAAAAAPATAASSDANRSVTCINTDNAVVFSTSTAMLPRSLIELFEGLFHRDPAKRMTVTDLLDHSVCWNFEWMAEMMQAVQQVSEPLRAMHGCASSDDGSSDEAGGDGGTTRKQGNDRKPPASLLNMSLCSMDGGTADGSEVDTKKDGGADDGADNTEERKSVWKRSSTDGSVALAGLNSPSLPTSLAATARQLPMVSPASSSEEKASKTKQAASAPTPLLTPSTAPEQQQKQQQQQQPHRHDHTNLDLSLQSFL